MKDKVVTLRIPPDFGSPEEIGWGYIKWGEDAPMEILIQIQNSPGWKLVVEMMSDEEIEKVLHSISVEESKKVGEAVSMAFSPAENQVMSQQEMLHKLEMEQLKSVLKKKMADESPW